MEEAIKQRLTSRDIWMRGLYMVLFAIAYSVAELVIVVLVIFQFVMILLAGRGNENALKLGNNLSTYVYQILQFQTFNTETRPFPFSDWPDETLQDNVWIRDASSPGPDQAAGADGPEPEIDDSGPTSAGG